MRKFSSYGPINNKLHYYAPRKALIDKAYGHMLGENSEEGGHYITVWAPRQTGKTWIMQQVLSRLQKNQQFMTIKLNLESLKFTTEFSQILESIGKQISEKLHKNISQIDTLEKFEQIFKRGVLVKPLILIFDEFDALNEEAISGISGVFRNIFISRQDQAEKTTNEKEYLLHGVALIGVRKVLGIDNVKGSPFNVQRSLHIPNLSFSEVFDIFKWYSQDTGQKIDQEVVDRLYFETNGQPGLTCWFGELLTEGMEDYRVEKDKPVTVKNFEEAYTFASYVLPSTNILNIINKAKNKPYKDFILDLFRTDKKIEFKYDDPQLNYLYVNGIIEPEKDKNRFYIKFSSPFVQKRLFSYFSNELFSQIDRLVEPFEDLEEVITVDELNIKNLMMIYQRYLTKNRDSIIKNAPRRTDLRIFEAVFHFHLFSYLHEFLKTKGGEVFPEFPAGNGKVDILIKYHGQIYAIELKSFKDLSAYKDALIQASRYAKQLYLKEIVLVFFVDFIDADSRNKFETDIVNEETGVTVSTIFIETVN